MSESLVLTTGILGYGERGKILTRIIRENVPALRLVAVADPDVRRQEDANGSGLAAYETAEELFDKAHPEVVLVASNPPHHEEHVVMAAERGCHIFCEKPLALSPEEADRMVDAVRTAGVVCTVDFETVFAESFAVLRRLLHEEWFGTLIRFDAVDKGRPPAYDIETCMPHFLHAMMVLTGSKPVEVFGRVIANGTKASLEDVVLPSERPLPAGAHARYRHAR